MVHHVHTGINAGLCGHALWYMPGNGKAEAVSFISDGSYNSRCYGTIDLYLCKAIVLIHMHSLNGFFFCSCSYNTQPCRAGTINDACFYNEWPDTFVCINRGLDRIDITKFITDISYSSYARGKIGRPPLRLFEMRMHIPQSRQNGFALCMNDGGISRYLNSTGFTQLFY